MDLSWASAQDMERRVVLISERGYSTTVIGFRELNRSRFPELGCCEFTFSLNCTGAAIAQIPRYRARFAYCAAGDDPPSIIQFNATNVPVAQLTISSKTLPEQQLYDYSLNFIRVRLFTIPPSTPAPLAGRNARSSSTSIRKRWRPGAAGRDGSVRCKVRM
jgi:hypothetical protein